MKHILLLAPHFPTPDVFPELTDDPRSKFLINYALEWVKLGNSVTVLHSVPVHPGFFDPLINLATFAFPKLKKYRKNPATITNNDYEYLGVRIIREPVVKFLPRTPYRKKRISNYLLVKLEVNMERIFLTLISFF